MQRVGGGTCQDRAVRQRAMRQRPAGVVEVLVEARDDLRDARSAPARVAASMAALAESAKTSPVRVPAVTISAAYRPGRKPCRRPETDHLQLGEMILFGMDLVRRSGSGRRSVRSTVRPSRPSRFPGVSVNGGKMVTICPSRPGRRSASRLRTGSSPDSTACAAGPCDATVAKESKDPSGRRRRAALPLAEADRAVPGTAGTVPTLQIRGRRGLASIGAWT